MEIKETRRLFRDTYQYKIVLVSPGAGLFRGGNFDYAEQKLASYNPANNRELYLKFKTADDLDYCKKLVKTIKKLQNYDLRIESPLISFYSNSKADIDKLVDLNPAYVKYISVPPKQGIVSGTVIMPKVDFEFKITMGRTRQEHSAFIEWADKSDKVKLTKSCRRDLERMSSWGGTHFYITGEKNLLVARMMLGEGINKVEKILKE